MSVDTNLQICKLLTQSKELHCLGIVTTSQIWFSCMFSKMSAFRQHGACGRCLYLQEYLHCAAFSWLCHLCGTKTTEL